MSEVICNAPSWFELWLEYGITPPCDYIPQENDWWYFAMQIAIIQKKKGRQPPVYDTFELFA